MTTTRTPITKTITLARPLALARPFTERVSIGRPFTERVSIGRPFTERVSIGRPRKPMIIEYNDDHDNNTNMIMIIE